MMVEDKNTAFITLYGVFGYTMLLFGLKNAGATYQRCMQAFLRDQIFKYVQVYVDDIVNTLIEDLCETVDNLDRYHIKLNPLKCAFRGPWDSSLIAVSLVRS
jgi:hypothetical protein